MFPLTEAFELTDPEHGKMIEDIATLGEVEVAHVLSSGHHISLRENEKLTLLIPKAGQLGVETPKGFWAAKSQTGLLFSPNRRSTRACSAGATLFEAGVLLTSETVVREEARRSGMRMVRSGIECHFEPSRPSRAFLSLKRYLGHLIDELARPDSLLERREVAKAAGDLAVEQMLHVLVDCGALSDGDSAGSSSQRQIKAAQDYIREHYATIGSMSEVAQAVGVGLRCLQVSFRAARGVTPRQALVRVRLECARDALLQAPEGSSVSTVAQESGFTHLGRFCAQYRKAFGENPSATLRRGLARQ